MNKASDLLNQVLDNIGYTDNKQEFVNKFLGICNQDALASLIPTLPGDKRAEFVAKLNSKVSAEEIKAVVNEYFTEDQYAEALTKASEKALKAFLETITPELNSEQVEKLNTFIATLS